MILNDYQQFGIHHDRVAKIERYIRKNGLEEKYMKQYQETLQ